MPAFDWAAKNSDFEPGTPEFERAKTYAEMVQNSSHTPQGAFGYLLSKMNPPPRLAVATHFQAADDTIASAMQSVRNHYPVGEITFASDLMVINVSATKIIQRRAVVSPYAFMPVSPLLSVNDPKYWIWDDPVLKTKKLMDPYAQIITTEEVPAIDPDTKNVNYRTDGY